MPRRSRIESLVLVCALVAVIGSLTPRIESNASPGRERAASDSDAGRIIDRFYEAYRAGSVERMLDLYAPDAVFEDVNQRHRVAGTEDLRAMLTGIIGLHDLIDLREKRRIMAGDTVVVEYEYAGRLSGAALSQATGREGCPDLDYALPATSWYRVENGRIVHQKDFIDLATYMELQQQAAAAKAGPAE